jgi:hypothetical protein
MEGIKFPEPKKNSFIRKIKNTVGPLLAAGALLTACDNSRDTPKSYDKPDRFTRTSEKIDQRIEEGKKARDIARRSGLEIKDGESFEYQKKEGVIVSFTVHGETFTVDDLLKKQGLNETNTFHKNQPSSSETKTNPEIDDFLK